MTTTAYFLESGNNATQDFSFWSSTAGNVSTASDVVRAGRSRAIKFAPTTGVGATVNRNSLAANPLSTNQGRLSFYLYVDQFDSATARIVTCAVQLASCSFVLRMTAAGVLQLAVNTAGAQIGTDGSTLPTGQWVHVAIAWNITSTTVYTITVWVNGIVSITVTNDTTLTTSGTSMIFGFTGGATPGIFRISDVYVDSGDGVAFPGAIEVTPKRPEALSTNNFAAAIGCNTAQRWGNVNERPVSQTNGWTEAANLAQVLESYGVESADRGDCAILDGTIVAKSAWAYASKGSTLTPAFSASKLGGISFNAMSFVKNDLVIFCLADQVGGGDPVITDTDNNVYTKVSVSTTGNLRKTVFMMVPRFTHAFMVPIAAWPAPAAIGAVAGAAVQYTNIGGPAILDANPADTTDSTSPYDAPSSGVLAQASEIVFGSFGLAADSVDAPATSTEDGVYSSYSAGGSVGVISFSAKANSKVSGTTVGPTGAITTNVGDLILLVGGDLIGSGTFVFSDSLGNTVNVLNGGTNTARLTCAYIIVAAGKSGSTTYTATHASSANARAIAVIQLRSAPDVFTGANLDVNPAVANITSSTNYNATAIGTVSQLSDQLVEFAAANTAGLFSNAGQFGAFNFEHTTGGLDNTNVSVGLGWQVHQVFTNPIGSLGMTNATSSTGVAGAAAFLSKVSSECAAILTARLVSSTAAVAPEITTSNNRTGIVGTSSYKMTNSTAALVPQLVDDGVDNAITLSTTPSLFRKESSVSAMPATVGLKSTGAAPETNLYECGYLIAYTPNTNAKTGAERPLDALTFAP